MRWRDRPQQAKIEHMRQAFGGMHGAPPTSEFHHYGIHMGPKTLLGPRLSQIVSLGPDIVHVSPIQNGRFLALWKIEKGEELSQP